MNEGEMGEIIMTVTSSRSLSVVIAPRATGLARRGSRTLASFAASNTKRRRARLAGWVDLGMVVKGKKGLKGKRSCLGSAVRCCGIDCVRKRSRVQKRS